MSAAYTPGPWKAVDVTSQRTLIYRRIVSGMTGIGFAGAYIWKDQNEAAANARLIAAAPDLVEALQEARLQLEYIDERSPSSTTPVVIARIDAALRKALGEGEQS